MKAIGTAALWVGILSLVVGGVSRILLMPLRGIEAHAFLGLAQACLLVSIAISLTCCDK